MIEHAVEQGLPSDFARRAAEGVVVNAAQLLTGRDPQKIVDDLSPIAARPPQRSMRWWRSSKPPTPDSLRPHANQRLWHSVECRPVLPKVGTSLHHGHNLGSEKYRGRAAWADPNDYLIAILRGHRPDHPSSRAFDLSFAPRYFLAPRGYDGARYPGWVLRSLFGSIRS
jgi:hypothetical protein